ncbi:bifunctional adenosylcobinamide kinase/adenosylcobinamide-phosphate guanylyltransferase [Dyadobacter sp. CY343]|uniref:bifunctional adenosylcobinamide kinase/adenosylcobinamide-phosphate guanylyltransferase n=1 Tax=Dyadobacter sp. CY343 TaxID=2907299 RepID=UPI001F28CE09|nr:bifunctional adenosylcobinamide kinase/adenosylcobinamide-phosphate guanylyltransferase [Dyadobacter sp. CY343]MCE7059167.1 bifunctional adenosylcobinamide kinase/adenosylcobinamide-phosphate guanylyltransferase [Dyadobacter sp. CY343]
MIIYISGGVRSGKSRYAQTLALQRSANPVYVATAKIWDDDFAKRVELHRNERGPEWTLFEQQRELHLLSLENRIAVIDCVTLWLTNLWMEHDQSMEQTLIAFKSEIDALSGIDATLIIISNEIGMGVHPETELGRKFADLQGWANQYVAAQADQAVFMVSGLPLQLK